jgi:hypothetical protein
MKIPGRARCVYRMGLDFQNGSPTLAVRQNDPKEGMAFHFAFGCAFVGVSASGRAVVQFTLYGGLCEGCSFTLSEEVACLPFANAICN